MPDPISWYLLPRTVDDVESIMEAIDAKLLTHNQDPSAHGQSGEVVEEHRSDEPVDHPDYSIYNISRSPTTRPFKCFVGLAATGDFEAIQAGIDYANLHGGGRIYVRPGTYTQTANITLYSNIEIVGEDNDTCIIDFGDASYGFLLRGTAGTYKRNLHLYNLKIINSHKAIYGAIRLEYVTDFSIKFCKFQDNYNSGTSNGCDIYAKDCEDGLIEKNYSYQSGSLFYQTAGYNTLIQGNRIVESIEQGLVIAEETFVKDNYFFACVGYAIYVTGTSTFIGSNYFADLEETAILIVGTAARCQIFNNIIGGGGAGDVGIHADGSGNSHVIVGNIIRGGWDPGIWLDDGDYHVVCNNYVDTTDGRTGILIDGTCDRCIVVANQLFNTNTPLTDNGTNTEKGHNIVA